MRGKLGLVVGVAAGVVIGSRMGREPLDRAMDRARQLAGSGSDKQAPAGSSMPTPAAGGQRPGGPVAEDIDPADLQFGHAAAAKQERLDQAEATGTTGQLLDEGERPRPANKATSSS